MDTFTLPYGKGFQELSVANHGHYDLILPNHVDPASNPYEVITQALDNPLEMDLSKLKFAKDVVIAVNDKTRPVPHDVILPALLDWLNKQGVSDEAIRFIIATGSHMPMQPAEYPLILPDFVIVRYRIESHDINDLENLIQLGVTSRGTPVIVNRSFFEADFKIVVGDIEPHHFAGFSGGAKSAAIGLSGRETINRNHAMLVDPNSWIGVYETNPLRQDINEIGRMIGINLALNTILTPEKKVIAAVSGSPDAAMRAGIPISNRVCGTPVRHQYDVVIASAGGYPKDINFYQAQKALTHASLFCKPGGTLILVAECSEGSGSAAYEAFMDGVLSVEEVFEKFGKMEFRVGPHKAFQVARLLKQYRIVLVSQISAEKVQDLLMEPAETTQLAHDRVISNRTAPGNIAVLPHATTTLPA